MKKLLTYGLAASAFAFAMTMSAPAFAGAPPGAGSSQGLTQTSNGNTAKGDDNYAALTDHVFQFAIGNMGVNVASGNANQQANVLYLDYGSQAIGLGFSTSQTSYNNNDGNSSDYQEAYIQDRAFKNAKGNVGVNVAAGNLNEQANSAVILNADQLAATKTETTQSSHNNTFTSDDNDAEINDRAFEDVSGNVGANVAAGSGNQQSNQLIINDNNGRTP